MEGENSVNLGVFTLCLRTTFYLERVFKVTYISRVTPNEWEAAHPCSDDADEIETTLTLHNCLWHNWGCLLQQGSDIAPK